MSQKKIHKFNIDNLVYISEKLKKFEHFIFYGTLLGITRENNILKNDDDIDFLININDKQNVLDIFKSSEIFSINEKVGNDFFVQLINKKEDTKTFVDFYFYINNQNFEYIIEKHNFLSSIDLDSKAIHIPKKLIFPIIKRDNFPMVNVPNKSVEVCEYLYGSKWSKPLRKNSGYRMEIIDNKPKLIKRSLLGSLTRRIKEFLNKNYKKD